MRISDWSSDVCSSDLQRLLGAGGDDDLVGGDAEAGAADPLRGRRAMRRIAERAAVAEQMLQAAFRRHRLQRAAQQRVVIGQARFVVGRSEEHTSELQSLMRISYSVFCLKKKKLSQYQTRSQSITVRIIKLTSATT